MLQSVSIDQLRMFVAAANTGSFSGAARQLNRAQSAISQSMVALENALGVTLFDRSERLPKLTPEGSALLERARGIVQDTDALKTEARHLAEGLEPELSLVLDIMFPQYLLVQLAREWAQRFPSTPLSICFEALGGVSSHVLEGRCSLGVIGTLQTVSPDLTKEWLFDLPMTTVVAPEHPLASMTGMIPTSVAAEYTQIVLTDRSELTVGLGFGVIGKQTWRVTELSTKQALLRAGLGWGHMPLPEVAQDVAAGYLTTVTLEGGPTHYKMPMSAVYRTDAQPGIGGRWLIDRLKQLAE
ncbi:LysR family transcriptional regulator [Saccharospirillum mangrovi]|uniref:LysR family transcriptional regulator n=1 Tax=Saccharospirillum mangrovi TaxID=2161747 RepID=UPI000D3BB572|nr:LysR family transcriptional regulator [Saccharospirillum mangrovi]